MKERALVIALLAAFVAGSALDLAIGEVEPPAPAPPPTSELRTRAAFCPPPVGEASTARVAIAAPPGATVEVGIEPGGGTRELRSGEMRLETPDERRPVQVVGYGARIAAGALLTTSAAGGGRAAARCALAASSDWYFAEGTSSLGYDQRLVVYNPFPDEAVATVTFFTDAGPSTKAGLQQIAVPSGEARIIKVNDFILREPLLASSVVAERGRFIVWRSLVAQPENRPSGQQLSLGATAPSENWYLPEGGLESGIEDRLALLNPTDEEAVVTISLLTSSRVLQPPKLVDVRIGAESLRSFSLQDSVGGGDRDAGPAAVVIRSTNEVGVVAERTVWYSTGDRQGVSSETGTTTLHEAMLVPPAALSAVDSLLLLNPDRVKATVSVTLLRPRGGAVSPRQLRAVSVKGGTRKRIPLNAWSGGQPAFAYVTSDVPIAAARVAVTTSDVATSSAIGVPPDTQGSVVSRDR